MAGKAQGPADLAAAAQVSLDVGEAEAALKSAQAALDASREAGDKAGIADALRLVALARCAQGKTKEAGQFAQDALASFKSSGDRSGEAKMNLALAEMAAAKPETAEPGLKLASEAKTAFKNLGDAKFEGLAALAAAGLHMAKAGDKKRGAEDAKADIAAAMELFKELGDQGLEGRAVHAMAVSKAAGGSPDAAVRAGREARELFAAAGLRRLEAHELSSISGWLREDESAAEAVEAAEEALDIMMEESVYASPCEAGYLQTLVKAQLAAKSFSGAMRAARDMLERFQEASDAQGEAAAFQQISAIHNARGSVVKAVRYAQKAAEVFEEVGDGAGQGEALRSLCRLYMGVGQPDKALKVVQEALNVFEELENVPEQAVTLMLRAEVFMSKNEVGNATRCATEARELYQDAKDMKGEAAALLQLAVAMSQTEEYGKALKMAEEAQGISNELGDLMGEAAAFRVIGNVNMKREEYDAAMKAGQRALTLYRDLGEVREEELGVLIFNSNATLMDLMKKENSGKGSEKFYKSASDKALKLAKEALALAKKIDEPAHVGAALFAVAQCLMVAVKGQEAVKAAEEGQRLLRDCGDLRGEGGILVLLANVHLQIFRDYHKAKDAAEEGVWCFQQVGDAQGEDQAWDMLDKIDKASGEQARQQQAMMMQQMAAQAGQGQMILPLQQQADQVEEAMPSAARPGYDPKLAKLDVTSGLQVEAVHKQISEVAKGLIGDDTDIEIDMPLMEAGLTSNTAVLLRDSLMQQLPGISLPVTLTFDYPSIGAMGELVMENAQKAALKAAKNKK